MPPPIPDPAPRAAWLVDAHVHLHGGTATTTFLDAAAANVAAAARRLGLPRTTGGVLMLAEIAGVDGFGRLAREAATGWRVDPADEPMSLLARGPAGRVLSLVAGRQVVTAEGIEVLALGARGAMSDGEAIETVLAAIARAGALAVLPWGFGKWRGRRGAIVRSLATDIAGFPDLCFGDSGVRTWMIPRPALLAVAERAGRLVLPGTDPLPVAAEAARPGRYGFVADGLDPVRPFGSLQRWLAGRTVSPTPYGRLERPGTFIRRQMAMQLRKRWGPAA